MLLLLRGQEAENLRFRSLQIDGWRQFQLVKIDFHPRLTILTGANGAGKTTLLNLLAPHFQWQIPIATSPRPIADVLQAAAATVVTYFTGVWNTLARKNVTTPLPEIIVGHVEYMSPGPAAETGGKETLSADIKIPAVASGHTFSLTYSPLRNLPGVYIPSHRPLFIPTTNAHSGNQKHDVRSAFDAYTAAVRAPWTGGTASLTPLNELKGTLLAWLSEPATQQLADEFSTKLAIVMPSTLGFTSLSSQGGEILFETESGSFTIDAVSGGIAALVDLTWQLFLCSKVAAANGALDAAFIALIDEPENHLHPELQRSVLVKLLEAYPLAQFVVSSHAPLIVTSERDAFVYALRYHLEPSSEEVAPRGSDSPSTGVSPQRYVEVMNLSNFDRAGTADKILRDVLGLDYTMPVWAADALDKAVTAVATAGYTIDAYRELDDTLKKDSLNEYAPDALTLLAERRGPDTEK